MLVKVDAPRCEVGFYLTGVGDQNSRLSSVQQNETKREGEKGEHISVRIFRILKKMYVRASCLVVV